MYYKWVKLFAKFHISSMGKLIKYLINNISNNSYYNLLLILEMIRTLEKLTSVVYMK